MKIPEGATHQSPVTLTFFKEVKTTIHGYLTYMWNESRSSWVIPIASCRKLPEEWKLKSTELNVFKLKGE